MWDRERTTQEKVHDLDEARERLRRERDVGQMLVSEDEWLTAQSPEALVDGLIYRNSLIQFAGGTKMGKTFFTLQLAICLTLGIPFLGKATRRSRVLYLSLEMPTGEMRERIGLICHMGKRSHLRLHEKGGKFHQVPVHHVLQGYLDAYIVPEREVFNIVFSKVLQVRI